VPRADYGGTRPDPKLPAATLGDGHESFVPLRCEALNLLKSQDRRIAFANDGRSPARDPPPQRSASSIPPQESRENHNSTTAFSHSQGHQRTLCSERSMSAFRPARDAHKP
jgi:hypothetical protein